MMFRTHLIWTRRVCSWLQGAGFGYLMYSRLWLYFAFSLVMGALAVIETSAKMEIEQLDERRSRIRL